MIVPATSVRNFMPTSIAELSFDEAVCGVAVLANTLQGQPDVVNVQLTGVITLPKLSVAPLTLAVYVAPEASSAFGCRVATFVVEL